MLIPCRSPVQVVSPCPSQSVLFLFPPVTVARVITAYVVLVSSSAVMGCTESRLCVGQIRNDEGQSSVEGGAFLDLLQYRMDLWQRATADTPS